MGEHNLTAHSSWRSSPKYSFNSAVPTKDGKRNIPGPGAYGTGVNCDKDKFTRSASWTMGGSTGRDGKPVGAMPGPGAYQPELPKHSPKWVFAGESRLKTRRQASTPGPGEYYTPGGPDGPAPVIMSKPQGPRMHETPGPGSYQPIYSALSAIETPSKVSFGVSSRSDMVFSRTPGPGAYDHEMFKNALKSIPKVSIKGKYPQPAHEVTPGPIAAHTQFGKG